MSEREELADWLETTAANNGFGWTWDAVNAFKRAADVIRQSPSTQASDEAIIDAIKLHVRMRTSAQLTGGYEAVEVLPSVVDALRGLGVASQPAAGSSEREELAKMLEREVETCSVTHPRRIAFEQSAAIIRNIPSPAVCLDGAVSERSQMDMVFKILREDLWHKSKTDLEVACKIVRALRAAGIAQVPEGCQVVPKEPNIAMAEAGEAERIKQVRAGSYPIPTDDAQARQNPVADYILDGGDEVAKLKAELAYALGQLEMSNEEIEQLRQDLDEAKSTAWDILIKEKAQARREGFEVGKTAAGEIVDGLSVLPNDVWSPDMKNGYEAGTTDASQYYSQAIASLTYPE
jgi:hypothetical protein